MRDANIPINDIAPLVEIHDYSFYYFLGVLILVSVVIATLVLAVIKQWKKRQHDTRHLMIEKLQSVDLSDPKHAAYTISEIGRFFEHDNERTHKAYHNLFERLEPYKYAPHVDPIDEETLGYYRLYLEIIDV
ncbi:MAG: hypothetical protein IE884_06820 [Sulfuricurvum sp.]|nr:hypothetical protein [Sulfuricurvum sp.]